MRLKESLREYDSDFPAPCRIRNRQALEETLAARGHALTQEKKEEKKIYRNKTTTVTKGMRVNGRKEVKLKRKHKTKG